MNAIRNAARRTWQKGLWKLGFHSVLPDRPSTLMVEPTREPCRAAGQETADHQDQQQGSPATQRLECHQLLRGGGVFRTPEFHIVVTNEITDTRMLQALPALFNAQLRKQQL